MRGVRWTLHSYYQRVLKLRQSAIPVEQHKATHVLNFLWFMDALYVRVVPHEVARRVVFIYIST